MALPTTITGLSTAVACVGPFKSSGGNFYIFGYDSAATPDELQAQKATDPTSSFSAVGTDRVTLNDPLNAIAGYQVGDVIHIVMSDGSATGVSVSYYQFDMSSDTWTVTGEAVLSGSNTSTSAGALAAGVSVVVRSNGNAVLFYSGPRVANMGNSYSQVYYRERTGVNTYGTQTQVSAGGQVDFQLPEAVLGTLTGSSEAVHFIHFSSTTGLNQRTLDTSNTLQTISTAVSGVSPSQAISYNSSGTIKVILSTANGTGYRYFDSANTPTLNGATAFTSCQAPERIFVDTGNSNKAWALYGTSTDNDLNVRSSTDNGATWSAATNIFTGTVNGGEAALSIDGTIYQRGNDFVIPYVVNDGGTLKYNEYVVRSIAAVFIAKTYISSQAVNRASTW